ncbi:MAG: hypothetical protein RSC60_05555 [Christensenellaceae bacterium]
MLSDGARTADIAAKGEKAIGTAQMGNLIVECLAKIVPAMKNRICRMTIASSFARKRTNKKSPLQIDKRRFFLE